MAIKIHSMLLFIILLFLDLGPNYAESSTSIDKKDVRTMVKVGVIVDMDSPVGKLVQSYISMALSDFYATNARYQTRLTLSIKDSRNDVVAAASAALELMKNEEVQAILGPQTSNQAKFVINLGERAQIPIISFVSTSPSLSSTQTHFFIRTALDDASQVKALTSIIDTYGWRKVVLIYEDTEYGHGLIPYITDAFQQIDTRVSYRCVISPSWSRLKILKELNKLMAMETRVFVVHMTASLGSKLFLLAKDAGMMNEGYAWIVTTGMSTLFHPLEAKVTEVMEGVIGVRPCLPMSNRLEYFKMRLKKNESSDISLFGLWGYDTIWALAKAVEFVQHVNASGFHKKKNNNKGELLGLRVSKSGPGLVQALLRTRFEGLSGEIRLIRGQLQPSGYEITNVISNRETVIGYWRAQKKENYSDEFVIKAPMWPGNASVPPKGWVIPVVGKKLRIGVPVTDSSGFNEFLKIEWFPHTNEPKSFSGFSYDVFISALERMPFAVPHKFIPFTNGSSRDGAGTYDELLYQIKLNGMLNYGRTRNQKFDAVVGDTTIIANRTTYVDFTLPYSESGVRMVVKVKDDDRNNIWIFLKPLSWDLWLTTAAAFIFTGLVVWILEHRTNTEFKGSRKQQLATTMWFSFSTLVFAHREKVVSNWTRLVLIIWIFVVLILTQSYSASLASMLTVERLQPAVVDVNQLRRNGIFVGYQKNSFVKELLTGELKFEEKKLRYYRSPEAYHEALSKGSKNGGVDAIFDEIPYVKLFLAKYCSGYTVVGPTYKTDGFGFAFPLGSPLAAYISRAVLTVTQDHEKMEQLQRKYFPYESNCEDPSSTFSSQNPSLNVYSFGGLFIITAVISISSCFIYIFCFLYHHRPVAGLNSLLWSQMAKQLLFEQTEATHGTVPTVPNDRGGEASTDHRNKDTRERALCPDCGNS